MIRMHGSYFRSTHTYPYINHTTSNKFYDRGLTCCLFSSIVQHNELDLCGLHHLKFLVSQPQGLLKQTIVNQNDKCNQI